MKRLIRDAIEKTGKIDVLVNNAGQGITRLPTQLSDEDIEARLSGRIPHFGPGRERAG